MSNVFLQRFPNGLAAAIRGAIKNQSSIDSKIDLWISLRSRMRNLMLQNSFTKDESVEVEIVTDFTTFNQAFYVDEDAFVLNLTIDDIVKDEEENLKQFFKVAKVKILNGIASDPSGIDISVSLSAEKQCERCKKHHESVGKQYKGLCKRCFGAVSIDVPQILFNDLFPCCSFERRSKSVILDILARLC